MVYPIFLPHIPVFLLPQTHENLQSKPKSTNNHQIFLSTPCFIPKFFTTFASAFRDVAQPGRVHVWGACCRWFESSSRYFKVHFHGLFLLHFLKFLLMPTFHILQKSRDRICSPKSRDYVLLFLSASIYMVYIFFLRQRSLFDSTCFFYTTPCASIASATFSKPAIFAPTT